MDVYPVVEIKLQRAQNSVGQVTASSFTRPDQTQSSQASKGAPGSGIKRGPSPRGTRPPSINLTWACRINC
ncbi:unnamed protein product [Lota lota]